MKDGICEYKVRDPGPAAHKVTEIQLSSTYL